MPAPVAPGDPDPDPDPFCGGTAVHRPADDGGVLTPGSPAHADLTTT
ncbi:hypothetical protein ACFFTK_10605 [Pseudonocardia petroleophila]|uniref:Uncharacterized protein n=1 Tax=Pseudonocardia petroleophila TaxID=37331 RepID=A0A7G7MFP8_9PSEU|nr:hypothetical protein [Pseudonocardia petroleophila]QNG51609.1 hypothetical protein H6H00_26450 [Pseudonocardia petroleophila]